MATAAEAQALMQAVACAYCVLPPGLVPYVAIVLFRKGGSMATTAEVQALIADAETEGAEVAVPAGEGASLPNFD